VDTIIRESFVSLAFLLAILAALIHRVCLALQIIILIKTKLNASINALHRLIPSKHQIEIYNVFPVQLHACNAMTPFLAVPAKQTLPCLTSKELLVRPLALMDITL
jgi:hypothetical protein